MARPERALDADAGPVEAFAADLRDLRRACGSPSYRTLAGRAGFSAAALAGAAAGQRLPTLPVVTAYVRACGGDEDVWVRRWRQVSAELAAARRTGSDPTSAPNLVPYRGLTPYGVDDGETFFGRRRLVTTLLDLVARHRFVAVLGASGSGKSSLLRAGLVPAAGRVAVVLTPGDEPMEALSKALNNALNKAGGEVPQDVRPLVLVDQFEELFTRCPDPGVRAEFVRELAACPDHDVVVGVRADFYPHCTQLPELADLLAGACLPVGPMTTEELTEVVTEPARRVGLSVERALVARAVADASGQPGALPMLSHALFETWRQRRGDVLTLAGYEATGGVAGAVAQTAEEMFRRLEPRRRQVAREVLLRLVTVGADGPDTRRRVARAELDPAGQADVDPAGQDDVEHVLRALAAQRLVVIDHDPQDGRVTVELAHEALIGAWPRLHDWLHTDRQSLRRHQHLTDAARLWRADGCDPGALYRGVRLAVWADADGRHLSQDERVFLAASRAAADADQRRARRRTTAVIAGLVTALVAVTSLAAVARYQAGRADHERDLADSRGLASSALGQLQLDQQAALLLARRAYDTAPTAEAETALRQAVSETRLRGSVPAGQGRVLAEAFDPTGSTLATAGSDGTVEVWARSGPDGLRPGPRTLTDPAGPVSSLAWTPDGQWLVAAGGHRRTVTAWDTATWSRRTIGGFPADVVAIAVTHDGRQVAAALADGSVEFRALPGPTGAPGTGTQPVRVTVGGAPTAIAFNRDGHSLAVGDQDGSVRLVDLTGTAAPRVLGSHGQPVEDLAFAPDGRTLASGGDDGTARIWDPTGTADPLVLRGGDGEVLTVAYSPDGRWLATGGVGGNTVRVWSSTSADDPLVLRGHGGAVRDLAFSPGGERLVSGSGDGTVRWWDPTLPGDPAVVPVGDTAVRGLAADAAGDVIAAGGENGTVRVWHRTGNRPPLVLHGPTGKVLDVALDRGGRWVAAAGADGTVWVWPVDGSGPARVLRGGGGPVNHVAFHPGGTLLATVSDDGALRLWDLTGRGPVDVRHEQDGALFGLAFSADGRWVATGGLGGVIRIAPVTGGGPVRRLAAPADDSIWCLAFSSDGHTLASTGYDGSVHLWDTRNPASRLDLRGHQQLVWTAAFSRDGSLLATAGYDGSMRVWDVATGRQLVAFHGQRSLTEQVLFGREPRQLVTAHRDGTVRSWLCDACAPAPIVRQRAQTLAAVD